MTPEVLRWAMEQSGVAPGDLAQRARVEASAVLGWLSGEAQPTKTQFRAIASLLRRPAAFFFLPRPPVEDALPAVFRHPPNRRQHEATRAELEAVATARRVQRVASWTAERVGDRRWAENLIEVPPPNTSPAVAAANTAEWLEWSTAEQRAAPSATAVVRLLRARLEDRGVLALQLSIGKDGCRGFSLTDDSKPLIAVSTTYNAQARLFSYLHELGHLIRRTDALCIGYADTTAERWCERFAASFLLPHDAFRRRLWERFGTGTVIQDLDQVRLLAADFNVSLAATAIRIEDLELGEGLFAQIPQTADYKTRGGGRGADNTRGAARTRELGEGYVSLLLAGERHGVLGRQDVLRYLDVTEGQLRSTGIGPLEP